MNVKFFILSFCLFLGLLPNAYCQASRYSFDFYADPISYTYNQAKFVDFKGPLSNKAIQEFYNLINDADYQPVVAALLEYKQHNQPNDWLFYQLVRKTANELSPKAQNYDRYTLYKWYLLCKTGYDAMICISGNRILFYVQSDENIYDIPARKKNGKQYVCLNYHDYGNIDFEQNRFTEVTLQVPEAKNAFSYAVTQLPGFKTEAYVEKDLAFSYNQTDYHFKLKINPQVKNIFANYPVMDYKSYLNIPLSNETYESLIPQLKENVKGMSVKGGVDYLMRFTRYAFNYKTDKDGFGKEKRLSPEQTLLYDYSDCEDRTALFFYLVKEIYNLPMIVLAFPEHVTIAVKFDKPVGKPILYNGRQYSVCEPTPQKQDLRVGQLSRSLQHEAYEVAYAYEP